MIPVRVRIASLAAYLEVPRSIFEDVRVRQFVDMLVRRGELDEVQAREFVEQIVAFKAAQVAEAWGRQIGGHVQRLVELRSRAAEMYDAVIEHFGSGRSVEELPANLSAEEFGRMFDAMNAEFAELSELWAEQFVGSLDDAEMVGDIRSWDEARQGGGVHEEPPLPAEEMLPGEPEPREWGPGLSERERVGRLAYTELMPEDPEVRQRVWDAAQAFAERWLPEGWRVWIRRVPRYGANEAAIAGLGGLDPIFAAEGYELVIESPSGRRYNPDGVAQAPNGRGFALAEWKEPYGERPSGWYNSDDGRLRLREDMLERAAMSQQIPGCGGWMYDTGVPWMDQLLLEIILEIRESPATADLGQRLMVPRLETL